MGVDERVVLSAELLVEEAGDSWAGSTDRVAAEAAMERGQRAVLALALLPEGWTVEREIRDSSISGPETQFLLRHEDGDEMAKTTRWYSRREDWHYIQPGPTTNRISRDEARGRAVLLLLAALDLEGRETVRDADGR